MKTLKKALFLSILFSSQTMAFDCEKATDQEIIKDALFLDFSGARIDGHEKSKCLEQKRFSYNLVVHDPSNEENSTEDYLIADLSTLKIELPVLTDKEVHTYKVQFSYSAKSIKNKKEEKVTDEIQYMKNISKEASKSMGCISVLVPPKKMTLLIECHTKEEIKKGLQK